MYEYKFTPLLSLFDGEGGTGVNGSSNAAGSENNGANVVYGKQSSDVENAREDVSDEVSGKVSNPENSVAKGEKEAPGSDEDFDSLIKGKFKDAFNKRVKNIVDRRLRGNDELAGFKRDSQELLEILSARYGVDGGDLQALTKAVRADDSFFEEAAEAEGLSVEQYKYKLKLERDNKRLMEAERAREANERMRRWGEEADRLSELYPGFNLNAEAQNPQFLKLLQSGIDVKTAYEVIHNDEIVNGAMRITANAVSKQIADNIRARGTRPSENGAANKSATVFKSDVSKLTKADRAEIARQARMGKKIEF